jgi:hypothetical protein
VLCDTDALGSDSTDDLGADSVALAMTSVRFQDTVPRWLITEVLEPVLADLQGDHPIEIDVTRELQGRSAGYVVFQERGHQAGAGLGVPLPEASREEAKVIWADYVQEQFFPETRAAWGQARPPCPDHHHPASATLLDGEAWWICPADGTRIGRIGDLR